MNERNNPTKLCLKRVSYVSLFIEEITVKALTNKLPIFDWKCER